MICIFLRSKSFLNKISRLEIALITSNTKLLRCTPLNPPMENYFPTNLAPIFLLHSLIFICAHFYLWKSRFICQNLLPSVCTYFHLQEFFLFLSVRISSCPYASIFVNNHQWKSFFNYDYVHNAWLKQKYYLVTIFWYHH